MAFDGKISEERKADLQLALYKAGLRERGSDCSLDFLSIIEQLREKGEELDVADLFFLQQISRHARNRLAHGLESSGDDSALHSGNHFGPAVPVALFLSQLLKSQGCVKVLNLDGGLGLVAACISKENPESLIDVVSDRPEAEKVISPLCLEKLNLHVGTLEDSREQLSEKYDGVVICGAVGGKHEDRLFKIGGEKVPLTDSPTEFLIADAANLLAPGGFFAVVVGQSFAVKRSKKCIQRNLYRFDLHLSSVLQFQPGMFAGTFAPFNLAIISRETSESLFVAEIPNDPEGQNALLNNLHARKPGASPSQGRIVKHSDFHGISVIKAGERYGRLCKNRGLEPILFSKVVPQITRVTDTENEIEENPDAVYLPEIGLKDDVTTKFEAGRRKALELITDPEIVEPEFLARVLNSEVGRQFRKSAMAGHKISLSILNKRKLYLPTLKEQKKAMSTDLRIQRLREELGDLQSQLWNSPNELIAVNEELEMINQEDRFASWLETLPFCLSAILKTYHGQDQSAKDKYERLLHFFECLTQFFATIHLSAFRGNGEENGEWEKLKKTIKTKLPEQNLSVERSTIGLWKLINEISVNHLKAITKNAEGGYLYRTSSNRLIEVLCSKSLSGAIQKANNYRNRWSGHGGAVTDDQAKQRHDKIKVELEIAKKEIGRIFDQYRLMEAGKPTNVAGQKGSQIFTCNMKKLMGSNPAFDLEEVKLTEAPNTDRLYMHDKAEEKALELFGLFQLSETPQPATYFYNRMENSVAQLVSYHLVEQSEKESAQNTGLYQFLQDLGLPE